MSNLQKFNTTLEDFDKEVGKLKAVSDVYQKLQGLTTTYDGITKQFEQNSNTLEKINELQKLEQEELVKGLVKMQQEGKQYKDDLSNLIENKNDLLQKENKEFYKDLASTIKIQLDDHRSQIKQIIEGERNQIKQIFEIEFAKNTKELRQVIENESSKQTQQLLSNQQIIKVSVWILGVLSIVLGILIFLR